MRANIQRTYIYIECFYRPLVRIRLSNNPTKALYLWIHLSEKPHRECFQYVIRSSQRACELGFAMSGKEPKSCKRVLSTFARENNSTIIMIAQEKLLLKIVEMGNNFRGTLPLIHYLTSIPNLSTVLLDQFFLYLTVSSVSLHQPGKYNM